MHEKAFAALVGQVKKLADYMVYPDGFLSAGQKVVGGWEKIGGFEMSDEGDELFTQIVDSTLYKKTGWKEKFSTKHIRSEIHTLLLAAASAQSYSPIEPGLRKLVTEYQTCDHEHQIVIPLVGLSLPDKHLQLGRISFRLYDPEQMEEFTAKCRFAWVRDDSPDKEARERHFASVAEHYISPMASRVCAEMVVKGEPWRATEIALEEVRSTLDLLRYAILFTYKKDERREIGILGDVATEGWHSAAIRTNQTGASYSSALANRDFSLDERMIHRMHGIGVFDLIALRGKANRSDFENVILRAVHWLASAQTQRTTENALLNLVTCLETFFKVAKDAPITATISEGVAYLTREGVEERKKRKKRVANFYSKRSLLTHEGDGEVTFEELTELTLIARDMTLLMIRHRDKFSTVQDFKDWLEDQKLSGSVKWPD